MNPTQPPDSAADPTHATPSRDLAEALARAQIALPSDRVRALEAYCQLLWKTNEQLNLTRHTTYDLFATRDVWDVVQLSEALDAGEEVLDVGSGGGVPGVPLAILRPDLDVSLCESVAKKARALESIVDALGVSTPIHHARAEQVLEDLRFDTLTARAVGPLWKICKWFEPHWASFRRALLIKGPRWIEERGEARHRGLLSDIQLRKVAEYRTAGMDGACVLLQLTRRDT